MRNEIIDAAWCDARFTGQETSGGRVWVIGCGDTGRTLLLRLHTSADIGQAVYLEYGGTLLSLNITENMLAEFCELLGVAAG